MQDLSLLTDPGLTDNKLYVIRPREVGEYRLLGPYGVRGAHARWALLTDGIGLDVDQEQVDTYTSLTEHVGGWRMSNGIASMIVEARVVNTHTQYFFYQNTLWGNTYGCGEFDLLLCAITEVPGLIHEPGVIAMDQHPSLADMESLTLACRQGLDKYKIGNRCQAGLDVAFLMMSVYLKNTVTQQTLQYEVVTFDSRGRLFNGGVFADTGEFIGIADSVDLYGQRYLQERETRTISVDVLPRLKEFLGSTEARARWQPVLKPRVRVKTSPTVLDPDLSHWRVLMASWGPFVNGAAMIRTTLEDVQLTARVV